MSLSGTHFRNLDSIRFIAAAMVLLSHIIRPAFDYVSLPPVLLRLVNTVCLGGNGVSLFFVLSGFLITYLLVQEHQQTGTIQLRNFYIRRSLRIWPLYFLVIAFAFGFYPLLKKALGLYQPLATNVWYHLGFLANFDVLDVRANHTGQDAMSQNINWSISIEEQFYVFWPLLFAFLPKKWWLLIIVIAIAGCFGFRIAHAASFDLLYFHTVSVLPDLFIGGLFALLIQTNARVRNFFQNCGTAWQLVFIGLLALLLLFRPELSTGGLRPALSRLPIALATALFISAQAVSTKNGPLNLGNWKFASTWGKYTYGIYLLHPIAQLVFDIAARALKLPVSGFYPTLMIGCLSIGFTFFLSSLSYRWVERPFLNLKDRFRGR